MSQNFEFLSKIGEGAFATVYKVRRKQDSQIYAFKKMKSFKCNDRQTQNFLNEIRILASLNSPYVVEYKEAFYDTSLKCLCLVTEFVQGGDLSYKINALKKNKQMMGETLIWKIALQLLHGVKALHKLLVVHRDIKPANILLNKNGQSVKLADMNVSAISKNGMAFTQTGTPFYSSPEVWLEKPYTGKSDIWSLGCVLYQMASFRPPFTAAEMHGLKRKIIEANPDPIPSIYTRQLQALIKICLEKDQRQRLTAQQILSLPFVREKQKLFPEEKFNEKQFPLIEKTSQMIGTIRIDKNNLQSIQNKLPKCNYEVVGKQNVRTLENKAKNNSLGTSKATSREHLHQKFPLINRPKSTNKVNRREVLIKLRS